MVPYVFLREEVLLSTDLSVVNFYKNRPKAISKTEFNNLKIRPLYDIRYNSLFITMTSHIKKYSGKIARQIG